MNVHFHHYERHLRLPRAFGFHPQLILCYDHITAMSGYYSAIFERARYSDFWTSTINSTTYGRSMAVVVRGVLLANQILTMRCSSVGMLKLWQNIVLAEVYVSVFIFKEF